MRKRFVLAATLLAGMVLVTPNSGANSSAGAAAQDTKRITVPAGTRILIRTIDPIDSTKQKTGYRFTATLETNLQAEDTVIAPRGTTIYGRLASASSAGRMKGSSDLTLELTDIVINGTAYPLLTSTYEIKGKGEGGNTAKKVVGGAGLGALIGGLAGGGKGAGIGALAGAGAGTAIAASKKGEQLQIPSESLLEFRLEQPVALPVAR
jgi:hypothetical protein